MTDSYHDALSEQLRKNVWDTLQHEAKQLSPLDYASVASDITGIFDPTPLSDGAGFLLSAAQGDALGAALSLVGIAPYAGDALAKPLKIAKKAPQTAKALEALLHHQPGAGGPSRFEARRLELGASRRGPQGGASKPCWMSRSARPDASSAGWWVQKAKNVVCTCR